MLKITPILCRAGKMDNYAYPLTDEATGVSAVLDPSEAAPVIAECERQNIRPAYIFNSHHHFDHVEGNLEVKEKYGAKVMVGAYDCNRIPGADAGLADGDVFRLGESEAQIIRADGHATGHILWYFPADGVLFTGDVLFNLSIGGLFEGTVEEIRSERDLRSRRRTLCGQGRSPAAPGAAGGAVYARRGKGLQSLSGLPQFGRILPNNGFLIFC